MFACRVAHNICALQSLKLISMQYQKSIRLHNSRQILHNLQTDEFNACDTIMYEMRLKTASYTCHI